MAIANSLSTRAESQNSHDYVMCFDVKLMLMLSKDGKAAKRESEILKTQIEWHEGTRY